MEGNFGEFTVKTYLVDENLANFVHSQIKNYENYVIRHNSSVNVLHATTVSIGNHTHLSAIQE